ncbi:MAG: 2-oxo acid dehydrogenase subunit E2, partial [Solirubrobacteraceae bacterium]|nr:2-oxo acid dehydrogenase subunit E2 [Solirubrobacteraceae bacterium]
AEPPGAADGSGRRRVSPLARRVAAHLGVDPASCEGTGPGGAVTRADVERAAAEPATRAPAAPAMPAPPAPPAMPAPSAMPAPPAMPAPSAPAPQTIEPPAVAAAAAGDERSIAMRRTIARLMARSKREIPHYYLGHHIDLSRALDWLKERNAPRGPAERVLPAALLLKAVALACREQPGLNGFWVDDELRPGGGVHVGVAISLRGGGLLAPAIHDADTLGVEALMAALRDLTQRARRGQLRGSEMADPTITVTSLGERGVETVYGVIHPPQVALVGFGRVTERAWAVGGMVGARPVVHATLAVDHRAADGHTGGLFLGSIDSRLQEPEAL